MKITWKSITALILILLIVWSYVSAPPPLPEATDASATATIAIEDVLQIVATENDIARKLYTASIVGAGQAVGLRFAENWKQAGIQAGPLPALFLREAASSIERSPIPLGLFLGSDYPINPSNHFSGRQATSFEEMKTNGLQPKYFFDQDTGRHTAMFRDLASVPACVSCHNEHPDSPKKDWVLNDPMGATTWSYPKQTVSTAEAVMILRAVRQGFSDAYQGYLEKVKTFVPAVPIGRDWPTDKATLPDLETFLAEFERRASANTLKHLLAIER
jgi:adenylate cyclase